MANELEKDVSKRFNDIEKKIKASFSLIRQDIKDMNETVEAMRAYLKKKDKLKSSRNRQWKR